MKKDLYIGLSVLAFCFAAVAVFQMVWKNRMPGTFGCEGRVLDPHKIYLLSNRQAAGADTVLVHFPQAAPVMPEQLAVIRFDRGGGGFVAKLSSRLAQGTEADTVMPLRPFAHTYTGKLFSSGRYEQPGQVLTQAELLRYGLKFNLPFGDRTSRVKLVFRQTCFGLLLETADDGMDVTYTLKSGVTNRFDVFLNREPDSQLPCVFSFKDAAAPNARYWQVQIDTHLLDASYQVLGDHAAAVNGKGANTAFLLGGYLFAIHYHYGLWFSAAIVLIWLALLFFQFHLLFLMARAPTPVIRALMSLRLLLNVVACLAMPLFLSAYYLAPGRGWYLGLLLLLNLTVFVSKDIFKGRWLARTYLTEIIAVLVILAAPPLFHFKTYNESLFGVFPILHCQKVVILLLFFVTRHEYFERNTWRYFLRLGIILGYVLGISLLTHDIGSFLYTLLAMTLVELIRKTVSLRQFLTGLAAVVLLVATLYIAAPQLTHERKFYRLVAPFQGPDAASLSEANEADRESFSTFDLDLKNIQRMAVPMFGDLVMPAAQRSTAHSDFSFMSSMLYGGVYFLVLYLVTTFLLVRSLFVLLFCATRECRINTVQVYTFPQSPAAEFVRILLAFTLVSFTFPVLSNLLLVPITGQSIPILSISNIEILLLILLLVPLEHIFNDNRYFVDRPAVRYTYTDLSKSLQFGLLKIIAVFVGVLLIKNIQVYFSADAYGWAKVHRTDRHTLLAGLPSAKNKAGILQAAKTYFGEKAETPEDEQRRRLALLNLASLYYHQKTYNELFYESKNFNNSSERLLYQMNIDSVRQDKARLISGPEGIYGPVYAFDQLLNDKLVRRVTQPYYQTVPAGHTSVIADLSAELNELLEAQLKLIGIPSNFGAVLVVDNRNGNILANSACPFKDERPASTRYYLPGSLKKLLVAYAALKIDASYLDSCFGPKKVNFQTFLKQSNDDYPAVLLKDLLVKHREELNKVLTEDYDLPLISATNDAYMDRYPAARDFKNRLDRHNSIYRLSIGQQQHFQFLEVMQWYARFASGKKLVLNFGGAGEAPPLSLGDAGQHYLRAYMNSVLSGTALNVRYALDRRHIATNGFICKTGTAAADDGKGNSSSSFIIADTHFTIGVMMSGSIPDNDKGKLTAKFLFEKLVPVLLKYGILHPGAQPSGTHLAQVGQPDIPRG